MDYIFLAVGAIIGGLVVWVLVKGKIALDEAKGRAAAEVERTSLAEQLKSLSRELLECKSRLADVEKTNHSLQTELYESNRSCAQFLERSTRLAAVEEAYNESVRGFKAVQEQLADLRQANGGLAADLASMVGRLAEAKTALELLATEKNNLLESKAALEAKIVGLDTMLGQERNQTGEKLSLLTEAREQLSNQFKALANEILDEKTKKFTDQNQANLTQLLDPLKQKISDFQKKVEDCYDKEAKDRSALGEQVKMLTDLNNKLSQDAENLTLALKGDRKAQGNYGEILLEDVLERANLVAGQHYDVQVAVTAEDGQTRLIPDVVVHLPGSRHIIVDAKFTLPDYQAFASATNGDDRVNALKRHLAATRAHIKGLSEKKYQTLYGLESLDWVVMFVPLEPAFMLAITNDSSLFHDAWERNVLLVSPSTLLFVIRTVANLWRQERITRNAEEISSRGAELYDKLVGFVEDLQKIGERLNQAQDSYNAARRKLCDGRGHVIRQAEMLKDLGVKPSKELPEDWVNRALDEASPPLTKAIDNHIPDGPASPTIEV